LTCLFDIIHWRTGSDYTVRQQNSVVKYWTSRPACLYLHDLARRAETH